MTAAPVPESTIALAADRSTPSDVTVGRPPVRPAEVDRTDLLDLCGPNRDRKVVLVSAPAGYGKSILAAQWCTADPGRRALWIGLSGADNDPVVLFGRLASCFDLTAALDGASLEALRAPVQPAEGTEVPALRAAMAEHAPFVLVLDDVHRVTSPGSLALIAGLIEMLPDTCQVLLSTRTDPDIGLARRRANGELLELRAPQLAMDLPTTLAFLTAANVPFSGEAAQVVHRKTEGWAAGIALAALSHDGRSAPPDLPEELTGERRAIADYLFDEVLSRQDVAVRQFLLHSAVVERFNAELCDHMLEQTGSSDIIRDVVQTNLFVIALDDERRWYRHHHLFQEMLAGELGRTDPAARSRLLRRAAQWHGEHGTVSEALRYAQAGGDVVRAGQLVLKHWQDYGSRGQMETLRMWVTRSTDDQIMSDPGLAIGAGWVFTLLGDTARSQRYAAAAATHPLDGPSADGATSLRSSLANLRSGIGAGGVDQMLEDGRFVQAAERPTRTRWLLGGCRAVGTAQLVLGDVDEAIVALEEADNAFSYRHGAKLREILAQAGTRHIFIKPHCPWQNGKVERLNRTLQTEWAYRQVFTTNDQRAAALAPWIDSYNHRRRHSAIGGLPPISRLSPT